MLRRVRPSWTFALTATCVVVLACNPGGRPERDGPSSSGATSRTDAYGWSCGPAALLAIGAAGGPDAAARLRTEIERQGLAARAVTSFYDLASCARRVGFEPVGLNVPAEQLHRVPLPAIAYIEPSHFLALMQVHEDHVVVADQGTAAHALPRTEFDRRFSGYVLCLRE